MRSAIASSLRRLLAPRHASWLLCLVLLLPLAQTVAVWHGVSHTAASRHADEPWAAAHAVSCDLCELAAAVGGGAGAVQPHALPLLAVQHAMPQARLRSVGWVASRLAYRSRAPPYFWV